MGWSTGRFSPCVSHRPPWRSAFATSGGGSVVLVDDLDALITRCVDPRPRVRIDIIDVGLDCAYAVIDVAAAGREQSQQVPHAKVPPQDEDWIASLLAANEQARTWGQLDYDLYLLSTEWLERREGLIKARGGACEACGRAARPFNVHHRRYPMVLGTEPDEDLVVLCVACHEALTLEEKLEWSAFYPHRRRTRAVRTDDFMSQMRAGTWIARRWLDAPAIDPVAREVLSGAELGNEPWSVVARVSCCRATDRT